MNKQIILIFILILALLLTAFIWTSYTAKKKEPSADGQAIQFEVEIAELRRLKELELDTAILEDSFFQNLQESQEVPPLSGEAGRKNPFTAL